MVYYLTGIENWQCGHHVCHVKLGIKFPIFFNYECEIEVACQVIWLVLSSWKDTYLRHIPTISHCWTQLDQQYYALMYQSIPSLTISPGNFFDGRIPHPPSKKEFKTPNPRAYKNELKPHPRGHFPQLFTIKAWKKMREVMQNCKLLSSLGD